MKHCVWIKKTKKNVVRRIRLVQKQTPKREVYAFILLKVTKSLMRPLYQENQQILHGVVGSLWQTHLRHTEQDAV